MIIKFLCEFVNPDHDQEEDSFDPKVKAYIFWGVNIL